MMNDILKNINLDDLNEEERTLLLNMINEMKTTGSSDTLKNLWYQDYDEIPVDIDTFIEDPYYLGNALGDTIYPFWRQQLREIFRPGAKYFEVVLSGAIGVGKTTIADVGIAYILHKLLCLKNPQSYYGLTKSSVMTINFFNTTKDQAYGVSFTKLQAMLMTSPWFLEHGSIIGSKNEVYVPNKNIEFKIGSRPEHALGQDVFCLTGDHQILTKDYGYMTLEDAEGRILQVVQLDEKENKLVISNPCYVQQTDEVTELIQLTLEDGSIFKATKEHLFMMHDGSYKKAIDIEIGDDIKFLGGELHYGKEE